MKIKIKRNPNGDTRTAPKGINFTQFERANNMHRSDVRAAMSEFAKRVEEAGHWHDITKLRIQDEVAFYRDFVHTQETGEDFTKSEWYQMHINTERHHLLARCPEDVNLIDVLEMIADCTCAGLARSGEVRELEINSDILDRAVKNTVKLLTDMIEVEE